MNIEFSHSFYDKNFIFYSFNFNLNTSPDYYIRLKQALKVHTVDGYELVRVGLRDSDGGYIMVHDFKPNGIAYSFGISDEISWDAVLSALGYNIFMYDHTINSLPLQSDQFHFFQEGIAGTDIENKPLKTLKYYIGRNQHILNQHMILKMDVEGAEWDFLETVNKSTLEQFDQIIFEFHDIIQTQDGDRIISLLEKLNKTHQLIHLHGNNTGTHIKIGDSIIPNVLEATYVNKTIYRTYEADNLYLPIELDSPNDSGREDLILGNWNNPLIIHY